MIQSKDLTREQVSGAFWVNLGISFAILVAMAASAPPIAAFYGDPRAGYVAAASGAVVFLGGFALQHTALLNRELEFGRLAMIDVATGATAFVATLGAALWLRCYWALVVGNAASAALNVALVWTASAWRPDLRPNFRAARTLLPLGGSITTFNLLNYLSRNLDNVLIARFHGSAQLGLYDRSYRLMMFPITNVTAPLSRVMLPVLSRLRDDPARYRSAFLTAVTGRDAARSARCGRRRSRQRPADRAPARGPMGGRIEDLLLAEPRSHLSADRERHGLAVHQLRPRTRARAVGGLLERHDDAQLRGRHPWGAVGVAAAYVIGSVLRLPLLYRWCTKETPVSAGSLFRLLVPPIVTTLVLVLFVRSVGQQLPTWALLASGVSLAYLTTLAATALLPEGRAFLRVARTQIGRFAKDSGVGGIRKAAPPVDVT